MSDVDPRVVAALAGECPDCGWSNDCTCHNCKQGEDVPNKIWVRCSTCHHMTYDTSPVGYHKLGTGHKAKTYNGTFDGTVYPGDRHATYARKRKLH